MERTVTPILCVAFLIAAASLSFFPQAAAQVNSSKAFEEHFNVMWSENHFSTSENGEIWYLSLDNVSGCGFQSTQKYRFGWFSMKLKLVGGDSAGVVTAYYMWSDGGPARDELDFEFLGNVTGQPYLIQTNVYKNGTGGREMRHGLWFDPTEDFHAYSILWNDHQILFMVDSVVIRVYKNTAYANNFFPNQKPMYLFSTIWDASNWATRGGADKTNWDYAPFVSSYSDFTVEACQWEDPYPACVSNTTGYWWDQSGAWQLSGSQIIDHAWVVRNLVVYDYCQDTQRYPTLPEECSLNPYK